MEDQPARQSFPWDEYIHDLMPLCAVKAEEFHLLGYEEVTPQEVLNCVQSMLKGRGPLHEVVSAILTLNVGQFMNFMTISAYKGMFGERTV